MQYVTFSEFRKAAAKIFDALDDGEEFVVTRNGLPAAQVTPFKQNVPPSWRKNVVPIKIKGEGLSKTLIKMRRKERA